MKEMSEVEIDTKNQYKVANLFSNFKLITQKTVSILPFPSWLNLPPRNIRLLMSLLSSKVWPFANSDPPFQLFLKMFYLPLPPPTPSLSLTAIRRPVNCINRALATNQFLRLREVVKNEWINKLRDPREREKYSRLRALTTIFEESLCPNQWYLLS